MSVAVKDSLGRWVQAAGNGKAEYGASTVRTGKVTIPANTSGGKFSFTFDTPMADTDYFFDFQISYINSVDLNNGVNVLFNAKQKTGADLWIFGAPSDKIVIDYTAFKLYTDTEYNQVLSAFPLADSVTDGNMKAVTSNAVYDAISQIKTETKARYKALSFNSIPGVTFAKRDNNPKALSATRVDNIIVLNYTITIQGTYTGESNWLPIFNASQLDSLLDDDEMLNDSVTPYFCSGITYTNNASYNKLDGIMNGYYLYFYNSAVFDMGIQGQIILGVQKTS